MENNQKHTISEVMGVTMENIKEMVDVNTIVGEPIHTPDGVTIIPVSKVSFGFASGGSEFTTKNIQAGSNNPFGGGGGAGVTIVPIAFLVVRGENVRMIPIGPPAGGAVERVIDMVPEVVDKVTAFIDKQKEKKEEA